MARDDAPPFERGATFYNGGTIDSNNLGGTQHEGKTWVFEDLDLSVAGTKKNRSNRAVKCMAVRNVSGIALLPKRLASLQLSGTSFLGRVDGYATTTAAMGYPIDEWLPAAGVPNNDLFWVVVDGPATVITGLANAQGNSIAVGDALVALTAATSQATTAGRVADQDLSGATSLLALQVQNRIGFAMTARTTNNTNSDVLVDVRKW